MCQGFNPGSPITVFESRECATVPLGPRLGIRGPAVAEPSARAAVTGSQGTGQRPSNGRGNRRGALPRSVSDLTDAQRVAVCVLRRRRANTVVVATAVASPAARVIGTAGEVLPVSAAFCALRSAT